jgi:arylsulfatase A
MIPQLGSGGWTEPNSVESQGMVIKGQLYDMESDPEEKINLWQEHPEIVKQLNTLLEKYKSEGRSTPLSK